MAKVKISDVAREAGVSLGTVSNALNHPEKVRPDTLKVINEVIDRMGYLPNQSARQLAGGRNKAFGLVLPRLTHGFSLQIANGAQTEARKHGYDVLIASASNDEDLQRHYTRYFLGAQLSGVLFCPLADSTWKPQGHAAATPLVYLDVHSTKPGTFVAADNEGQGRIIAEHAIARNARRVAVIGCTAFPQSQLRALGIERAFASRPDITLEITEQGAWDSVSDGYEIAASLMAREEQERPDFIIGLTDVLASGAIAAAEDAGLDIPRDIRIAGCDGNPLAWGGRVPLTTVAPTGYEIGRKGVQLLFEQIEAGRSTRLRPNVPSLPTEECRQELVRPFLLQRASTGASAASAVASVAPGVDAINHPELNLGTYL